MRRYILQLWLFIIIKPSHIADAEFGVWGRMLLKRPTGIRSAKKPQLRATGQLLGIPGLSKSTIVLVEGVFEIRLDSLHLKAVPGATSQQSQDRLLLTGCTPDEIVFDDSVGNDQLICHFALANY